MDDQQISSRVIVRQSASAWLTLAAEETPGDQALAAEYWRVIAEAATRKWKSIEPDPPPPAVTSDRMSDDEARRFGRLKMPQKFKKHAGTPIDSVPLEYLELLTQEDSFVRQIKRYLRAPRIVAEE
jgi:hypothetical protein